MLATLRSATVIGIDAAEIEIEVNAAGGKTLVVIVGLPDTAVKESRDRVTAAITNSGYRWPDGRTTVNLAPADLKKEGPGFDLPIAIGMIAAGEDRDLPLLTESTIVGELALTGAVRPVRGVLSIALEARRAGRRHLFVPAANAPEAALIEGISVYGVHTLRELYNFLQTGAGLQPHAPAGSRFFDTIPDDDHDFADVKGQASVKRALEVAAAGGHNLLMIGPPGSGKSMLAKRLPSIMPPLTLEEAIETTRIHSVSSAAAATEAGALVLHRARPFRSPVCSVSDAGLLGGSQNPSPGEISLAHHGVLFLDELPEFRRTALEALRQPLEDGRITISRAAGTMTFPAQFMLVAAMNPCPCGHHGDRRRACRCSQTQIEKYRARISGPLLDRVDIQIEVPAVDVAQLATRAPGEPSAAIRSRVQAARHLQRLRLLPEPVAPPEPSENPAPPAIPAPPPSNARLTSRQIRQHCAIDPAGSEMLRHAITDLGLSARAHDRILKVARTIADLAASPHITTDHLAEAIGYRNLDRKLWV